MSTVMRRRGFAQALGAAASGLVLGGLAGGWKLAPGDLVPPPGFGFGSLKFTLTDAETGKTVTAADFHGRIVMLFFGYTNCPDMCPLTLTNAVRVFHRLGPKAADIRFLFVTVDPGRDALPVLKSYLSKFSQTNLVGLRGTPTELASVAARMGARYSVHPSTNPEKYTVTHTALTYVFNREGAPEFSITGLERPDIDLNGIARDLAHLVSANQV